MRLGCARCKVRSASLPTVTSRGEGKYVGDVKPKLPTIDATCAVIPIFSPAVRRLWLRSRQSARGVRSWKKWAWTSISIATIYAAFILGGPREGSLDGNAGEPRELGAVRTPDDLQSGRYRIHQAG